MSPEFKDAMLYIIFIIISSIGWLGYWTTFQENIKLKKQINKFYHGTEREIECGSFQIYRQNILKILQKAREITGTRSFSKEYRTTGSEGH